MTDKVKELVAEVLSDEDAICISQKSEFSRGGIAITLKVYKQMLFSNINHDDISKLVDEILQAQLNAITKGKKIYREIGG